MAGLSCVIFLPDDMPKTGYDRPLLLHNVLGAPLLSWLTDALQAGGVERFFLVCRPCHLQEARSCFPKSAALTCPEEDQTARQLYEFLSQTPGDEDVIVVTGPCVLLPYAAEETAFEGAPEPANMVCIARRFLTAALEQQQDLLSVLRESGQPYTDRDGVYDVRDRAELPDWQPVLNRARLWRMAQAGVEIWDYNTAYVQPSVTVAPGAVLLPGTVLRGETTVGEGAVVGPNTYVEDSQIGPRAKVNSSQLYESRIGEGAEVGPYAYIHRGSTLGEHTRAGAFVEVHRANAAEGTRIPRLSYVGDAEVGKNAYVGAGTVTANFDRAKKYRTILEDDAFVGANVSLIAPMTVGKGAYVAAGTTADTNIPEMALAITRARQQIRRDWSSRHKQK